MLIALILLFTLLNPAARLLAAFFGGVGFGFFIDEVGKFISNDVNYFFQPAVAVMYVLFMLLFLVLSAIRRWDRRVTPRDALANALTLLQNEQDGALDQETQREVLALLNRADAAEPIVPLLRRHVAHVEVSSGRRLSPYAHLRTRLANVYRRLVLHRRFHSAVIVVAWLYLLAKLPLSIAKQFDTSGVTADTSEADAAHWFQLSAGAVSSLLIMIGLVALRRSRLRAYRWFLRAVLVSLLIGQVFVFYYDQFAALGGLIVDLLLYTALRYMIGREEADARTGGTDPTEAMRQGQVVGGTPAPT
jgi:hypothetical protein